MHVHERVCDFSTSSLPPAAIPPYSLGFHPAPHMVPVELWVEVAASHGQRRDTGLGWLTSLCPCPVGTGGLSRAPITVGKSCLGSAGRSSRTRATVMGREVWVWGGRLLYRGQGLLPASGSRCAAWPSAPSPGLPGICRAGWGWEPGWVSMPLST